MLVYKNVLVLPLILKILKLKIEIGKTKNDTLIQLKIVDASIHFSPKINDNISKEYILNINEEVVIKRIDTFENKKSFSLNFIIEL